MSTARVPRVVAVPGSVPRVRFSATLAPGETITGGYSGQGRVTNPNTTVAVGGGSAGGSQQFGSGGTGGVISGSSGGFTNKSINVQVVGATTQATPPPATPPTLLPPRGFLQSLFRARGYVPLSALKAETAYGQQLQGDIATVKAQVASLTNQLAALATTVNPLSGKASSLQQQVGSLQSQIASLQSYIATLTSGVASTNSTAKGLAAEVAALQADLGSGGAGGSLASIKSKIAAIAASVTGVAAAPTESVLSTNKTHDSADPLSGAIGFGPSSLSFFPGFQGMSTSSGPNLDVRYSALGGASGGLGGSLPAPAARMLGYIPISQITTLIGQQTALASNLGTYTGQLQTLKAQFSALNSQGNLLLGLIPQLQAQITSLTATLTGLKTTVAALKANASSVTQAVAALQQILAQLKAQSSTVGGQIDTQAALLQNWQSGSSHFPISIAWSFGDGGTSTSTNPNHTLNPGSFNPTVTITVTTPDGKVWVHTFKLPGLLIGQWPATIYSNSRSNQTLNFLVQDKDGMAIPNNRVSVRYQVPDLAVDKVKIVTVGSNGSFSETVGAIGSGVPWSLTVRSLRNPTVVFTTSGT